MAVPVGMKDLWPWAHGYYTVYRMYLSEFRTYLQLHVYNYSSYQQVKIGLHVENMMQVTKIYYYDRLDFPLSHMLWMNVAWKVSIQHFAVSGPIGLSWELLLLLNLARILLLSCQYLSDLRWCGTGRFQKQGQCHFIGLAAHSLFVSYCFPFHFFHSMAYGLVLWGWSLQTDMVLVTLSQDCTADTGISMVWTEIWLLEVTCITFGL